MLQRCKVPSTSGKRMCKPSAAAVGETHAPSGAAPIFERGINMNEITPCKICGATPVMQRSYSGRLIKHRCCDFTSGWGTKLGVTAKWNTYNEDAKGGEKVVEKVSDVEWNGIEEKPPIPGFYWIAYDNPKHYGLPRQAGVGLFIGNRWKLVNGLGLAGKALAWAYINYPEPPQKEKP